MNENSLKSKKFFLLDGGAVAVMAYSALLAVVCACFWPSSAGARNERDAASESRKEARRAAQTENRHKSGFISRLDKMIKNGEVLTAERFERLKKEIAKLRERMAKRAEKIDKKMAELTAERARIQELLKELATVEVAFDKLKVYSGGEKSGETEAAAVRGPRAVPADNDGK